MEKRILGIILSILGVAGLIIAGVKFMNGPSGNAQIREVVIFTILGIIFFFSGISLIKKTKDKPT